MCLRASSPASVTFLQSSRVREVRFARAREPLEPLSVTFLQLPEAEGR